MRHHKTLPLFLTISCLFSCGLTQNKTLDNPEDSDLEVWITERLDSKKLKELGCTYLPGWFGAEEWLGSKYTPIIEEESEMTVAPEVHVTYLFSGYPDLSDPWVCTRINITDPEVHVYGLSMASSKEEIDKRMNELAFEKDGFAYTKNSVSFFFDDMHIAIYTAPATNKSNIVY